MPMLSSILMLLIIAVSAAVLVRLCVIDLKIRLLPNVYVLAFAILGVCFHALLGFQNAPPLEMVKGAALGGGILYAIRFIANWHYKQDTLGLGDVKLMAAAGLWLGPQEVLFALSIGAFAGILHGMGVMLWHHAKTKEWLNLARLEIPAGPGFIVGIVIAALAKFAILPHLLFA
jgi:leader peptidase (prepilin peptidase)/N-methyltransferase